LVERDRPMRSQHVANVTSRTLCPIIEANIDRRSYLMTDENVVYPRNSGPAIR
jgi:hypothetical protein